MKTCYWNDDSMSFTWKGKDIVSGQEIPEEWIIEQMEVEKKGFRNKLKEYCETQQISDKPTVEFGEKKQKELEVSRGSVNKLKERISVLVKENTELQKIAAKHEASMETLENIDAVNDELSEAKEELKELEAAQKKIGEYDSFLDQLKPILEQDSISKDDKSELLEMLEKLKGGE